MNKGHIYPLEIPEIIIRPKTDFLLVELPPRYLPMMPNGLGYVHNMLKRINVRVQTIDANIIMYHNFHSSRLLKNINIADLSGESLNSCDDPWDNTAVSQWTKSETLDLFKNDLNSLLESIRKEKPVAVGFSIHGANRPVVNAFIASLRKKIPETIIVLGGYDCVFPNTAKTHIKDYDYIVVGESEVSFPDLAKAVIRGERPKDLDGIISRFDSPKRKMVAQIYPDNLDQTGYPTYDWIDSSFYRSYSDEHLVPITASRGCNWGQCRFCAECFPFRRRDPVKIVDEIGFHIANGFSVFHFNESDVNGDFNNLKNICNEIIKRKLSVKLIGQLRINRKNSKEYFLLLAEAGFISLRFGVDGWTNSLLKKQGKGYSMVTVFQNLKDCHAAGIRTAVNAVIGVPGETDEDIEKLIGNVIECKESIDLVEGLNTLTLAGGSEYYNNPEKYNIVFKGDKEELYQKFPYFIPPQMWFSEKPYIDQQIRLDRTRKICDSLKSKGVKIGDFVWKRLEELEQTWKNTVNN